ncbi:MAG: hypothetical protein ACLFU9_07405, partial [Candidatus Bathyarchaeia archaeon]
PYSSCGQQFEQPVLVTDYSKLPRETHYACPHCMLRLELHLDGKGRDGLGHVQVKAVNEEEALISKLECEEETRKLGEGVSSVQASRPSKSCRHFLGYLRSIPEGASMPDECAVCPNILQCYMKRE